MLCRGVEHVVVEEEGREKRRGERDVVTHMDPRALSWATL